MRISFECLLVIDSTDGERSPIIYLLNRCWQVGFSGGVTVNPSYKEVCTGQTGHCEVVRVVFDADKVTYRDLLKVSWRLMPYHGCVWWSYETTFGGLLATPFISELNNVVIMIADRWHGLKTMLHPVPFHCNRETDCLSKVSSPIIPCVISIGLLTLWSAPSFSVWNSAPYVANELIKCSNFPFHLIWWWIILPYHLKGVKHGASVTDISWL